MGDQSSASAHIISPVDQLLQFTEEESRVTRRARELYAATLAPDFNVLRLLGGASELTLSQVLRWLLDPRGDHGQGTAFLHAFVKLLAPEWLSRLVRR